MVVKKMPVKELHIAENMADLQSKCVLKIDTSRMSKEKLSSMLMKLESKASEAITINNDEEQAYMYLYRAHEVWKIIMNTKDFKEDKKYYKLQYGKTILDIGKKFEQYSKSLDKRYASKGNSGMKPKDELSGQFELLSSIDTTKFKLISKSKSKEQGSLNILNGNTDKKHQSDSKLIINEESKIKPSSDCIEDAFTIRCSLLWEKMSSNMSILIIDIRPADDFVKSKIKHVDSINISESKIKHGLSAHLLGEQIENDDQMSFWKRRDQYNQVVLMDWSSEEKDIVPECCLFTLFTILNKWDPDVVYKSKPLILIGGFTCWMDCYPNSVTNKNIVCPATTTTNATNTLLGFSDIEYPTLEEKTSPKSISLSNKPENSNKISNIPFVDRSTKTIVTKKFYSEDDSTKITFIESNEEIDSEPIKANLPRSPEDPHIPDAIEKNQVPSPSKLNNKGDGGGIIYTEKIKDDTLPQNTSLKRSASSPNINKIGVDLDLLGNIVPTFDRSTKPNHQLRLENYHGDAGNDTVYAADNKKGIGLTGLKNLGNLCYMNSIMQCISNTVQLSQNLTQFNLNKNINRQLIATEVSSLLRRLWQDDSRITSCRELKGKVGKLKHTFSTSEQQDSHEFLTLIMDWLHEDLNSPPMGKSLDGALESTGEKAWGEFKLKNNSIITDLFYGQLKSTVTCKSCRKESILFEPFSNLSIPLPSHEMMNDHKCTLQECLSLYLKHEVINGWNCPSCKSPREATKKLDISRLPPVLIIHLKRFMTEVVGGSWCRKRMDMVDFPLFNLDMKPYTPAGSEQRFHNFNLYAVSNHYGNMDSGHYTAYCKNHSLKGWYKFDDQDVNEMSQNEVKSSAAYILFYENNLNDEY